MNFEEIIKSGLLESYVLGTTNAAESAMIQNACKKYPELVKEIEIIEESLLNFSSKLAPKLNSELKNTISSQLQFSVKETNSPAKIIPLNPASEKINLYKFGIAASLLLFVTSLIYNILLQQNFSKTNGELAELLTSKSYMANQLNIQQTSIITMNMELAVLANPKIKTIVLTGMNSLEKKSVMIHLNTETQEIYFNANELPESPLNKQYQLWAIVDGKPVDAGMIDLAATSSVFQKMKSVKGAQAFAVTIENMGGSSTPTMETMCLQGSV